jgi:hypothetical protein
MMDYLQRDYTHEDRPVYWDPRDGCAICQSREHRTGDCPRFVDPVPVVPDPAAPWEKSLPEYNEWTARQLERRAATTLERINMGRLPHCLAKDAEQDLSIAMRLRFGENVPAVTQRREEQIALAKKLAGESRE